MGIKNLRFLIQFFISFKIALDFFTKYSYNSLVLIGLWPDCKYKQMAVFQCIFSFLFLTFSLVIPQALRLLQVWGDLDLTSNVLCTAELPYLVALTKMMVLFYNRKRMCLITFFVLLFTLQYHFKIF